MDTRVFCVYNLARGVFLSSKVTVADGANQPLKILKVLVSGLALDSESGLWLSPIYGMPAVPRLFPFDLLYLDKDHRVVDSAEVVPGVEFPPYRREVASALVLPLQTLHSTHTGWGDQLMICLENEVERLLAALNTSTASISPNGSYGRQNSQERIAPVPGGVLGGRMVAPVPVGGAVAVAEDLPPVASQSVAAANSPESSMRNVQIVGQPSVIADSRPEGENLVSQSRETANVAASIASDQTDVAKIAPAAADTAGSVVGKLAESDLPGSALEPIAVADNLATLRQSGQTENLSSPKTPVMSITEVVLERSQAARPPIIIGQLGGAEDLFSNWVDAPSLSSALKARNTEPKPQPANPIVVPAAAEPLAAVPSPTIVSDPVSSVLPQPAPAQVGDAQGSQEPAPAVNAARPEPSETPTHLAGSVEPAKAEEPENQVLSTPEPVPLKLESPAIAPSRVSNPSRIVLPQPTQTTTFTVAHGGMWRVSMPTAVVPVAATNEPHKQRPVAPVDSTGSEPLVQAAVDAKETEPAKSSEEIAPPQSLTSSPGVPRPQNDAGHHDEVRGNVPADVPRADKVENLQQSADLTVQTIHGNQAIADILPVAPAVSEKNDVTPITATKVDHQEGPRTEPGKASGERLPDAPVVTDAPALAAEAVEIVQRKLGIGQPKVSPPATPVAVLKTDPPQNVKIADAKSVSVAENSAAKEPATKKERDVQREASQSQPLPEVGKPEQNGKVKISTRPVEANGKPKAEGLSLGTRFKRWLNPAAPTNSDRRRAHRRYVPGMVAHYYSGGAPKPHEVADISMTGFYLLTEDRWMPETMIQMTLQKPCAKGERKQSITVLSRVVRRGSDGVAAEFVMPETLDPHSHDVQPSQTTDRFALARFI